MAVLPLFLSYLLLQFMQTTVIKLLLNNVAVGNYAIAIRISESVYFIPLIICNSVFPALVNARNISEGEFNRKLQNLYDLMVWTSVIIAIPLAASSNMIISLLFGDQYSQ